MENELKLPIWKIANAAIEMHENKLNGKEFEELAMNTLRQVKKLNAPVVSESYCTICNKKVEYHDFGFALCEDCRR